MRKTGFPIKKICFFSNSNEAHPLPNSTVEKASPGTAPFCSAVGALPAACKREAAEGPWDQLVTNRLYEVRKYITESQYCCAATTFFMNADFYASPPEAYQTLIDEISAETLASRELIEKNARLKVL